MGILGTIALNPLWHIGYSHFNFGHILGIYWAHFGHPKQLWHFLEYKYKNGGKKVVLLFSYIYKCKWQKLGTIGTPLSYQGLQPKSWNKSWNKTGTKLKKGAKLT